MITDTEIQCSYFRAYKSDKSHYLHCPECINKLEKMQNV